jgi:hypothetical protein
MTQREFALNEDVGSAASFFVTELEDRPQKEYRLNTVPAAAATRVVRALSGLAGRKASGDGHLNCITNSFWKKRTDIQRFFGLNYVEVAGISGERPYLQRPEGTP